mmetsp:Transcript_43462/g.123018  ORF Transcript_43462/g.123018 Transcript_43462/m.123018 type:complete len:201 (-) Transcript_43462:435-1037(-)
MNIPRNVGEGVLVRLHPHAIPIGKLCRHELDVVMEHIRPMLHNLDCTVEWRHRSGNRLSKGYGVDDVRSVDQVLGDVLNVEAMDQSSAFQARLSQRNVDVAAALAHHDAANYAAAHSSTALLRRLQNVRIGQVFDHVGILQLAARVATRMLLTGAFQAVQTLARFRDSFRHNPTAPVQVLAAHAASHVQLTLTLGVYGVH